MTDKHSEILGEARIRFERGDYSGAERSYRKILRRRPADAEALYMLGILLLRSANAAEAIKPFLRALENGYQRSPVILENLGTAYLMTGDSVAAERYLREAVDMGGNRAVLKMRLGMALAAQRRLEEAEITLRAAQKQEPKDIDIGVNLGTILAAQGRTDEALECFYQALKINPGHTEVLYNIATLHREAGRFKEAIDVYAQTLAFAPDHIDALNNLGTIHERLGDVAVAVDLYRKVLMLDPGNVQALCNLGSALLKQGDFKEAEQSCRSALKLAPDFVDAAINLGAIQLACSEFEKAGQTYLQASRQVPEDPDIRHSLGMLRLALGDFAGAWEDYQARPSRRHVLGVAGTLDEVLPEQVAGKTVLVIGEQGIGDELFFLRGAVLLKNRGAQVTVCCDAKILGLLAHNKVFDTLVTHGSFLPARDFTFAAGDLPLLLSRGGSSGIFPEQMKPLELIPQPHRVISMQRYLAQVGPPPYLAVTWRAGTRLSDQRSWRSLALSKEVPLGALGQALRGYSGTIISLQRSPHIGEMAELAAKIGAAVHDASGINDDLEDMLALLTLLDEYIGVSNTNMHLFAGLGRKARVLVPNPAEWRWMAVGDQSPWFPGFALYRQAYDRTWEGAMTKLRVDLSQPIPA